MNAPTEVRYTVMRPFRNKKRLLKRGDVVSSAIQKVPNFPSLLRSGFLRGLLNKEGEELVSRCYIIQRRFMVGGEELEPGKLVDLRDTEGWRNEGSLLETGFIRLATTDEVAKLSADGEGGAAEGSLTATSAVSSPPEPAQAGMEGSGKEGPAGPRLFDDPVWLREQYHELGLTTTEMGKLAGCPSGTISKKMEKYHIPRRARGRRSTKDS